MKKPTKDGQPLVYQTKSGALEIRSDEEHSTIWASQAQIAGIFEIDNSVVSRHIRNIFKDNEIDGKSNVQKMQIANSDKPVYFYSLDIVLAVGYRTNSSRAIEFRRWATRTLRSYIVEGYAVNRSRISENYQRFLAAVDDIKKLLPPGAHIETDSVIELISMFANTWLSLDAYDKGALATKGVTKKKVVLTAETLSRNLGKLKQTLLGKGEASEVFGVEQRSGAVSGIVGNIMQTFGGRELYGSVEEKAAHLLYFMIKDHPFADGNKRSAAFAFAWFLQQAKVLDAAKITPPALTALAILVAESRPKEKDKMIGLILTLLIK